LSYFHAFYCWVDHKEIGLNMSALPSNRESPADRWLTPNQQRVFSYLRRANGAVSVYQMVRDLDVRAATTVYRALDELSRIGLVHRIESQNSYVACNQGCAHHAAAALMVCENCGIVREIKIDTAVSQLRRTASQNRFAVNKITIEVIGRCTDCRSDQVSQSFQEKEAVTQR
jgi:Fur family transcriptional regulator, zinc uptake regulator